MDYAMLASSIKRDIVLSRCCFDKDELSVGRWWLVWWLALIYYWLVWWIKKSIESPTASVPPLCRHSSCIRILPLHIATQLLGRGAVINTIRMLIREWGWKWNGC